MPTRLASKQARRGKNNVAKKTTKNADDPRFVIQNWMRTRFSIDFLGLWEQMNNPHSIRVEFDTYRNESGINSFVMTP